MKRKIIAVITLIIIIGGMLISCNNDICPTYNDVSPRGQQKLR